MAGPSISNGHVLKRISYAPSCFEAYGAREMEAVQECLKGGWLAGFGAHTHRFEEQVAQLFGKKYGLFVCSGSAANLLALAALNLPRGSKVITPACTFSTTVAPILQLGYEPIFIDVELDTYVPSVPQIMVTVTADTENQVKVIMVPNLIGNVPDWKGLKAALLDAGRSDIFLVEDSADTIPCYGSEADSVSDVSTTSFDASHLITACGSGGMVMFNSEEQLRRATMYRDWGRLGDNSEIMDDRFTEEVDGIVYDAKFLYGVLGYNFKSSEVNAAFGLVQLERLEEFIEIRTKCFDAYIDLLQDVPELILPKSANKSVKLNWLAMPLQILPNSNGEGRRLELLRHLESRGIQTRVLFSGNITRHPAYREYLHEFQNADRIMRDGFLLGCHHGMTVEDVRRVCSEIKALLKCT